MSNIPDVPIEKVLRRWEAKALELQKQLFNVEAVAEVILEERDAALARIAELETPAEEMKTANDSQG